MTDVHRIMRLREDKPALQNLLQKGSIGDDLWNSLLAAEKELEAEILEVAAEANSFVEGWGSVIFQTATEMIHNEKMRAMLEQIPNVRAEKGQPFQRSISTHLHTTHIPCHSSFDVIELKYPSKPGSSRPLPSSVGVLTPSTAATTSSVTSSMASSVASSYTGSSVTSSIPPASPYPQTPLSGQSSNGLAPPSSAGAESTVSSDAEGPASSAASTPRTPKVSSHA